MKRTRQLPALVTAAPLLLAACGSNNSSTQATPSPTPKSTYDTVVELRDAAMSAGYPCPAWTSDNKVQNAAQSGRCSDKDVFSIYLTSDAVQQTVTAQKRLGAGIHVLVGQNWIINAPAANLPTLKTALGGTIVEAPAA
ncbi:hypothetical protein [Propionibacterium freudenreichii]|uniref:hypothetical protein n=2 Tax=Propionibacterium freudenreichii TaxID=1744 RepID=UPI00254A2BBF|nr:hypothetical protein [Propionibacterium freudenreichii]MDK9342142.1 hypothetical protein [Propionibacterium freudenreichii]